MEKGFLDKVKDNADVRAWSETIQHEKGDSLAKGYVSELWDITRISVTQNNMKVDKHLFQALVQFWNSSYSCFTFGKIDLVPTIEEYMALLWCSKIQVNRVYSRAVNVPTFLKKLMNITGMNNLVVFPKALGHVDEAVTDLFDRLDRGLHQS
ncbi:hypothetical protein Goklo_024220 [Gossypium klotzschianum]|uniref:DUF7745 domain-containing protein n=1 Tax=Gossypium klotzschianum TaxID=34286 RepID=A0A7J8WA64_9ROSI|nr:hypothetical protein [Gossypium klotzschianum]